MMSPRLPTRSRSERRITFMSLPFLVATVGAVALEHLGLVDRQLDVDSRLGIEALGGDVTVTAPAPVARWSRPLAGDAPGVRQQRHLPGDLDRAGDVALLLHVVARDAPVADLR